jgi:sulfur relay (sulfurtransferase) complex TusBCD TusD component (DsrE family)
MSEKREGAAQISFMLMGSPESGSTQSLVRLTEAALGQGHQVRIFLMCDGVYQTMLPAVNNLAAQGAEVVVCAHNAEERGVGKQEGVLFGSQFDLATMVAESDAYLALI